MPGMNAAVNRRTILALAAMAFFAIWPANSGFTQFLPRVAGSPPAQLTYADVADLYADAPLVIRAKTASAIRVADAPLPPNVARFYVEATATTLIRGTGGLAPQLKYLIDVPADSRGRFPKLKKIDVLLAARPVAGRPGTIQLVAPDAQQLWTPALDARVRAIVNAATAPDAPPVVTGVASAFHVAGTVIGEGETQIFLATTNRQPVSASVLRRPGEAPRWALALGEIVDEAATKPQRDTLGWYRLACFLPPDLPPAAVRDLGRSDAEQAREDYALVRADLGACPRTRPAPANPQG